MTSNKKLVIELKEADKSEIIIAWASTHSLDAIVENESSLEVYLADAYYDQLITTLLDNTSLEEHQIKVQTVQQKNWNAEWEANFKPISIGDLYIRAPFHPAVPKYKNELIIAPKMAFGTGHHETTFMMLESMKEMNLNGLSVLDYGCGTGILTVFAKQQNCGTITGIDIQEEAVENTYEHFALNEVPTDDLTVKLGDLEQVHGETYDFVLANINRQVLLQNAEKLKTYINKGGTLLMSGILKTDKKLITEKYTEIGFTLLGEKTKGEWCCFVFEH